MIIEPIADRDDVFLTAAELADRHRKTVETLSNERTRGEGVPFVKLGSGKILYRLADVLEYERAGQRGLTWSRIRSAVESFRDLPPPMASKLVEHMRRELA